MVKLVYQYIHQYEFDTETEKSRTLKQFTTPIHGTKTFKKKKKVVKQMTTTNNGEVFL